MAKQIILIIRHAEKPQLGGNEGGVDLMGNSDPKSLTSRGWQRAGAWAELFVPSLGQSSSLPTPTTLFASAPVKSKKVVSDENGSKSQRPLETITPLAAKLKIEIDLRFSKGDETELGAVLSVSEGVVLVCWQHENIAAIAEALDPTPQGVPKVWPEDHFNVIFKFERNDTASAWAFEQLIPLMLLGDDSNELE